MSIAAIPLISAVTSYSADKGKSSVFRNNGDSRRHSPRGDFTVKVDLVLDPPQKTCAEDVVYRVNDAGQEDAFLHVKWDGVVSHGPVAVGKESVLR